MKKIIISLTCIFFFNFVSCRSLHYEDMILSSDEYVKYEQTEGKPEEIYIYTKDSLKYHFSSWMYDVKNDSMYAEGPQIINGTEVPFKGYIPLQNINSIEWTEQKQSGTLLGSGIIFIMIIPLALAIIFIAGGGMKWK